MTPSIEERAKVAAKVAEEKGVPADLLMGDDEEMCIRDRASSAAAP